jgi:anaerobic selenocysteine-containing dehydrogenase
VNVHVKDGVLVDIKGLATHPQNKGRLCPKGRAAVDLFYHQDRLLKPLKKMADGSFREISRDQALDEIAERMRRIEKRYGARAVGVWKGEAVGFYQQEEYARRFIRAFGSPNYFSNDSACFNGRYLAYRLVNGFWNFNPEFAHADLIILWGTNTPYCHPPAMIQIKDAKKRGAKLIVIDPRRNPIAHEADIFAQPMPGTDAALGWGLNRYLIENECYDRELAEERSTGFELFAQYANRFTPEFVERQTGVYSEVVVEIGEMIIKNRPRVIIYPGAGLEHHENGVNTVRTLASLQCLYGALNTRGGLTRREEMGVRKLTLYEEIPLPDEKPIGAEKFPVLYDLRRECHTMTAMEYMLGRGDYPLKGLIVTGANPVITNPNSGKVAKAFSSLDLLVVNDLFLTETAKLAHYVFPAASFLERAELHYYLGNQMVALTQKVAEIEDVYDEYSLWRDLAQRLGFAAMYFPWKNEDEVNRWILEPTGITVEELHQHPEGLVYKSLRYGKHDRQPLPTASGRVEFTSSYLKEFGLPELPEYVPPLHLRRPRGEYPFVLTTGARMPMFCHSRYRNIPRLRKVSPIAEVEIHPVDAARLKIEDKERVRVISEIGSVEVQAKIVGANEIVQGVLQITHGWDDGNVNLVTHDLVNDPISGFPLLKAVPVRIERVHLA